MDEELDSMSEPPLVSSMEEPVQAELVPPDARWSLEARPPVRLREIVALVALVVVADMTLYRGHGPAGIALLLVISPILLLLGAPRLFVRPSLWVVGMMLQALAARLVWCGSILLLPIVVGLIMAFAMSL
ncbi:MAG: hypothetical protein JJ992_24260, partial [Planctomycetes bacterium]|nr:hypothetical protein [Planctomycetota bacterium]